MSTRKCSLLCWWNSSQPEASHQNDDVNAISAMSAWRSKKSRTLFWNTGIKKMTTGARREWLCGEFSRTKPFRNLYPYSPARSHRYRAYRAWCAAGM
jgi:hypothetical protein